MQLDATSCPKRYGRTPELRHRSETRSGSILSGHVYKRSSRARCVFGETRGNGDGSIEVAAPALSRRGRKLVSPGFPGVIGRRLTAAARHVLRATAYALAGGLTVLVVLGVVALNSRPDLKAWHRAELDAEFSRDTGLNRFADYLRLEDRLFEQLDREVYRQTGPEDQRAINRYARGSLADPERWETDWNRSFEWPAKEPRLGILLLHGLSDSPYSLRSIGEAAHAAGGWVIGLRLPGHGTAPSALLDVEWEDWNAAVHLAMRHLREQVPGEPLFVVGYSNGGALAMYYTLDALVDESLPRPDGLVLISPEIGISRLAALAIWQERLGHLLGLEKLAWNVLQPEYDPWKYNSFTLNAAKQAHRLTAAIQRRIDALEPSGALARMPPVIAFQSVVDGTITAPALVNHLFRRLPPRAPDAPGAAHRPDELVLFDFNRYSEIEPLIENDPSLWIDPLREDHTLPFAVTLITNDAVADRSVVAVTRHPGAATADSCGTGLFWPEPVYSLSHVALPFAPDDPVYGRERAPGHDRIFLGDVALRGEHGVLTVPPSAMLRLRWNPFHSYLMGRVMTFTGLAAESGYSCRAGSSGMAVP